MSFHGGTVEFVSFNGTVLKVRMGVACLGCPLSTNILHGWVEGTVKQFFPQIEKVESETYARIAGRIASLNALLVE